MNATTTQLTTRLRTWALVAGLTGLTIAIGAMLGGTFLWLFVAFAVTFNVVGYFFSDRIALRVARARPLGATEAPELYTIVERLAERAGIPMPRLYVMPGEQPNAFATGRSPQHAAVAMTHGLLTTMESDHVRGVVAHELAHIRNHDILVSSIAATIAGAISAIASVLQLSFLFGADDEDNPLGLLGSLAVAILAPIAATLLQLGVSRQREYLADATAARLLGSGAPLADALAEIEGTRAPALEIEPATAPMYIANPLGGGTVATLFSTHPPVRERIRRLRAYGERARTERTPSTARLSGA
ncbi:MAG TPA: zinc metalloprotease HtpX [Solirubrobacteraceae bacterium]|nr:zinc metalloprotease HtpX [Solirubrobacteraceae bacterium]